MKRKCIKTAIIIFGLLFVTLFGWRMRPHSLSDMISVDKASITSFTASARVGKIKDGESYFSIYDMNSHETNDEILQEILEILDASAYRADYRNLLPWRIDSVGNDKNYDGRVYTVVLGWGNDKEDYVEIQFLSNSIIAVKQESDSEFMIYHPTNRNVLDSLIAHIQENGNNP